MYGPLGHSLFEASSASSASQAVPQASSLRVSLLSLHQSGCFPATTEYFHHLPDVGLTIVLDIIKCHQCTVTRTSVPLYSLNMILDVLGNFHHVWRRLSSPLSTQDRAVSSQCPTHQLPSCWPAPCVELHSHCLENTPLRLSSSHAESILYGRSPTCRSLLFSLVTDRLRAAYPKIYGDGPP